MESTKNDRNDSRHAQYNPINPITIIYILDHQKCAYISTIVEEVQQTENRTELNLSMAGASDEFSVSMYEIAFDIEQK